MKQTLKIDERMKKGGLLEKVEKVRNLVLIWDNLMINKDAN